MAGRHPTSNGRPKRASVFATASSPQTSGGPGPRRSSMSPPSGRARPPYVSARAGLATAIEGHSARASSPRLLPAPHPGACAARRRGVAEIWISGLPGRKAGAGAHDSHKTYYGIFIDVPGQTHFPRCRKSCWPVGLVEIPDRSALLGLATAFGEISALNAYAAKWRAGAPIGGSVSPSLPPKAILRIRPSCRRRPVRRAVAVWRAVAQNRDRCACW